MTPTRLRQIADRLELACSESRKLIHKDYRPCTACRQAAEELREYALELGPAKTERAVA